MNVNVDTARRRLEIEERSLADAVSTVGRMRELALSLGNASYSDSDHEVMAVELEELVKHMASIANTRDAKGEYIFSGSQGADKAYELKSGRWEFQGDPESRKLKVSNSVNIQTSDSGMYVFDQISGSGSLNASGAASSSLAFHNIFDENALATQMVNTGGLYVEFTDNAGTQEMTVRDHAGNVVDDRFGNPMQNIAVHPILGSTLLVDGANILMKETPAVLPATTRLDFDIGSDNIMNSTLEMVGHIRTLNMNNPADAAQFEIEKNTFIERIDQAIDAFSRTVSSVGTRLSNLDRIEESNFDFTLVAEKNLTAIADLDYAKASTDLAKSQTALEASYASFAKIQNLSLFDYLR